MLWLLNFSFCLFQCTISAWICTVEHFSDGHKCSVALKYNRHFHIDSSYFHLFRLFHFLSCLIPCRSISFLANLNSYQLVEVGHKLAVTVQLKDVYLTVSRYSSYFIPGKVLVLYLGKLWPEHGNCNKFQESHREIQLL